jgi:hypothetical protein
VIKKGETLYYVQIIDKYKVCSIIELEITLVTRDWFVGMDKNTKTTYSLENKLIGDIIFYDKDLALDKLIRVELEITD